MFYRPFQFRLWHLFATLTIASFACWFMVAIVLPIAAVGSVYDLPAAEQAVVAALENAGLRVDNVFT